MIYKLANFCKLNQRKLYLSNNVKLAIKLNLNGAYISAYNRDFSFNNYKFKKDFKIIGSAHNLFEINIKKQQKIVEIFISPVFKYKKRISLGIHRCNFLFNNKKFQRIALGGVNEKNIKLLKLTSFIGFAAIDMYKKKGPK